MRRKGLSPVVATVILVACAITVAVAVAYWMGGMAPQYLEEEVVWEPPEFAYNATILIDVDGNVWAHYFNGTHNFYVELETVSDARDP